MITLVSPLWDADGRAPGGYRVTFWRGAVSGRVIARVDLPPGDQFRAVVQGLGSEADAASWAEAEIRARREERP